MSVEFNKPFDQSKFEDDVEYEDRVLADGQYTVELASSKKIQSRAGDDMLVLSWRVVEGEDKGA